MRVLLENFKEKVIEGNAEKALAAIDLVIAKITTDAEMASEILQPVIITELHQLLIDHLSVPPKSMKLTRRFPNNKTRALMFSKAMRNGVVVAMRQAQSVVE